jgi:hypothetical protein
MGMLDPRIKRKRYCKELKNMSGAVQVREWSCSLVSRKFCFGVCVEETRSSPVFLINLRKQYQDVNNVVFYDCVNFQNEVHCISASVKMINPTK